MGRTQPPACVRSSSKIRVVFTFLSDCEKKSKESSILGHIRLYKIQIVASINKVLMEYSHTPSGNYWLLSRVTSRSEQL